VGRGRHHQWPHLEAGVVDGHDALRSLCAAVGTTAVVEGNPPFDAPRATWGSVTTMEGVGSARPSASRGGVQNGERTPPRTVA
jgi:hypothetical protein